MRIAVARRNAALDTFISAANAGLLSLYTGTRPANADTALAGNTLLATLTLNATSFVRTDGTLTANAITSDSSADATGTVSFVRLLQSDGTTPLADFGVSTSTPADGTECQLPTLSIVSGQPVTASSLVITFGVGA